MIVLICFGRFMASSFSAVMSGFPSAPITNSGLIQGVFEELLYATVAVTILWQRGFKVRALVPHPEFSGSLKGIVVVLAAWIFGQILILPLGPLTVSEPGELMLSNASLSLWAVVLMSMVNGTYEEVFLLAFLQRGLAKHGPSMALGVTLLVRTIYHLYQGPVSALFIFGMGVVFGVFYWLTRSLWPVVFAHILADIVPLTSA